VVQFRKSKKIGPFRFTVSQKGISTSAGAGPLRISKGADGKVRRTVRIPGTGIYDVKVIGQPHQSNPTRQPNQVHPMTNPPAGWYPDPSGSTNRRYWDGQQWTNSSDTPVAAAQKPDTANDGGPTTSRLFKNLRDFATTEVPDNMPISRIQSRRLNAMFIDPECDTSDDSPLLGALAQAILELEIQSSMRTAEAERRRVRLKGYVYSLEGRLKLAGVKLPPVAPDLADTLLNDEPI
jgi:hypothetical protein